MTTSKQARADAHVCDTCRGTGNAIGVWSLGGMSSPKDCLTCLGAGCISDRIPVADALADAETLRSVALEQPGSLRGTALWIVRAGIGRGPNTTFRTPFATGRKAARYAFRAVPELKGE